MPRVVWSPAAITRLGFRMVTLLLATGLWTSDCRLSIAGFQAAWYEMGLWAVSFASTSVSHGRSVTVVDGPD